MRKFVVFLLFAGSLIYAADLSAATRGAPARGGGAPAASADTKTQSNNTGTPKAGQPAAAATAATSARAAATSKVFAGNSAKVAKSAAEGIDGDECKEEYWGCMDQFCILSNENGGRCACSNDVIKLDREYKEAVAASEAEIRKNEELATEIEFGGEVKIERSKSRTANPESRIPNPDEEEECDADDIACKVGAGKYNAAAKLCETQVSADCKAKYSFNKLQYSQNIRADCAAYSLSIKDAKEKGAVAAAESRKQMRETAMEQFEAGNKFNESECRVELKACMAGPDACGADFARCADRDIQNYRSHCEKKVLDNCKAVADQVWDGFAGEIEPTLIAIRTETENKGRQSCLPRISDCIVKACKDDIAGKGEATMDGCLARPEMARSFCKVELDECDPNDMLWAFVKQRLAAMRVDRCTEEVKECLSNDNACGEGYGKCLGLDMAALYEMCPVAKLVVCKQDKPDFALADVENIVRGIFLQIDNKQLDDCIALIDDKMTEVCGSTVNCDKFTDENLGTKSLMYSESGGTRVVVGVVDWGALTVSDGSKWGACVAGNKKNCDEFPKPGTILIDDYVEKLQNHKTKAPPEIAKIIDGSNDAAADEVKSVAGEINRIINLVEGDQKVGWCVNGRDMGQVTGRGGQKTGARFPLLLQAKRRIIAEAALRRAVDNHNKKIQELVRKAEEKADAKMAEYMCYSKPMTVVGRNVPDPSAGGSAAGGGGGTVIVIAREGASDAEIRSLAGTHVTKIDDFLTKEITAAWMPETTTCRICVVDNFRGARRYVAPRVNEVEALKKELAALQDMKDNEKKTAIIAGGAAAGLAAAAITGVGIAAAVTAATAASAVATATALGAVAITATSATIAGTATGAVAATTTAMTALGTAAGVSAAVPVVGWIAAGVIATAAIAVAAVASVKHADPMDDQWDVKIDYCFEEKMGIGDD